MKGITDKVVIVTGGGSGIGAAIAERFHAEGAKVVIAGRDRTKLEAQCAKMNDPANVRLTLADVGKLEDMEALIAFCLAEFGSLDVLVNNAGLGWLSPIADTDPAMWRHVLSTDLDSVFYGAKFAIPHLIASKGSIINIASICGVGGDVGFAAYNAAKGGVINFTRSLALEMADKGVRANVISPGLIRTPSTEQVPPPSFAKWEALIPMARAGTADEIAGMAVFLASAEASYITGQNFVIDGGITAHTGQPNFLKYRD